MLATAVIMFREVLEAALIIAIVLSASRGIAGRGRWVAGGIVLGLFGAAVVATLANAASGIFTGNGQAMLNAAILLTAVAMLTWHNVWMSAHGRQISSQVRAVGLDVQSGDRPLAALMVITLAAVMREGSEAVLFLWAIATGGEQSMSMVLGGFGGVMAGVAAGLLLYAGLLRIPVRHFFSVASWMVVLLAAGLAAQAAGFLNQVGLLPSLGHGIWNTSDMLNQSSIVGQLLHILVGYIARPSGIEVLFYVATLLTMPILMQIYSKRAPARATEHRA